MATTLELVLLYLVAAVGAAVLCRLWKLPPMLGYLAVGVVIGPNALALAQDIDAIRHLAEFGVVFLMFVIGLDFNLPKLRSMRSLVFGLGLLQVLVTMAAALAGHALLVWAYHQVTGRAWEMSWQGALVLGSAMAMSSTAIVVKLMAERLELDSEHGKRVLGVLLFQDLAVVPLLVLISILGAASGEGSFASLLGLAMLKGVLTVVGIYLVGRRVVRPLFHQIAVDKQPDTFTALTLLTTLGVAALTWVAGLSMALGALLAGLIIAETEFRHEVEITIEPFKGLLMGLFFMSVGMGIDLRALLAEPLWIPLSVVGLLAMKALIVFVLLRVFGLSWGRSAEGGLLLGQGGEFAFIVIGMALTLGLLERQVGQFMLIVVGVSMLAAPVVIQLGQSLGDGIDRRIAPPAEANDAELGELGGHVIIAGYGRVGQLVGQMLEEQGVGYVAIENNAQLIAHQRKAGVPLVFGDASRPELLRKLRLDQARAVVLTMDHTAAAIHAVHGIRRMVPMMRIIARARDEKHALLLREAGASVVVPETLESSLKLTGWVLETLGIPPDAALRLVELERERRIVALRDTGNA